mmetsp:Transcript_53416/g.119892  ORF Transcript_53416/g.119892 Transcript_53416/m.119892 type:complete len:210 (+) Transcript_53416:423-1052(+)
MLQRFRLRAPVSSAISSFASRSRARAYSPLRIVRRVHHLQAATASFNRSRVANVGSASGSSPANIAPYFCFRISSVWLSVTSAATSPSFALLNAASDASYSATKRSPTASWLSEILRLSLTRSQKFSRLRSAVSCFSPAHAVTHARRMPRPRPTQAASASLASLQASRSSLAEGCGGRGNTRSGLIEADVFEESRIRFGQERGELCFGR